MLRDVRDATEIKLPPKPKMLMEVGDATETRMSLKPNMLREVSDVIESCHPTQKCQGRSVTSLNDTNTKNAKGGR